MSRSLSLRLITCMSVLGAIGSAGTWGEPATHALTPTRQSDGSRATTRELAAAVGMGSATASTAKLRAPDGSVAIQRIGHGNGRRRADAARPDALSVAPTGKNTLAFGLSAINDPDTCSHCGTGQGSTGVSAGGFGSTGTRSDLEAAGGYGTGSGSLGIAGGKTGIVGGGNSGSTAPETNDASFPRPNPGDGTGSVGVAAGPSAVYGSARGLAIRESGRLSADNSGIGGSGNAQTAASEGSGYGTGAGSLGISAGRSGIYGGAFISKIPRSSPAHELSEPRKKESKGARQQCGSGVGSIGPGGTPRRKIPWGAGGRCGG